MFTYAMILILILCAILIIVALSQREEELAKGLFIAAGLFVGIGGALPWVIHTKLRQDCQETCGEVRSHVALGQCCCMDKDLHWQFHYPEEETEDESEAM